ncbi:MAG: AAA family ATPase, partial [Gemmatimonadota bacterium]
MEYLKSFGLYRDFVWDTATLKDFKRYNLIYGWNYSGKTTLSRAFQALERGELAAGLQEGTFLFTLDNGAQIDSRALTPKPDVRVFNRDYVRRNISAETAASAVYVVGEDAIKLRARIGHVGRRAAKVRARLAELSRERSDLGARRDFIGTGFARTVASQTRDKAFNRARLEGVARALPAPRPSPLTDEELAAEGEY